MMEELSHPNRSTAVMQQRRTRKADGSLDHFPTPPWATRALCEWLRHETLTRIDDASVWEPACAEGHMSRVLAEYFGTVHSSDIKDYGFGETPVDFLWHGSEDGRNVNWIITNPPFILAAAFAEKGIQVASDGVALIVRSAFLEGQERYATLFSQTPPSDILQFVERVAMVQARLDREASSATAYCWLVWRKSVALAGTRFHWLPPCRKRLERDSDYE